MIKDKFVIEEVGQYQTPKVVARVECNTINEHKYHKQKYYIQECI